MAKTTILFEATDSSGNQGLWSSDGTASGTSEIVQGSTANGGISPSYLVSYGNEVLFAGTDLSGNSGLWVTQGTPDSTSELAVGNVGSLIGLAPTQLTAFNGEVYFAGQGSTTVGLWVTDGTAAGTSELAVANAYSAGLNPNDLTAVNTAHGTMLAFDGTDANGNGALWVSDGTAAGTSEIYVGSTAAGGVSPHEITQLSGTRFVFAGYNADSNEELFVSNGTASGTSELTKITGAPGAAAGDFVYQLSNMVSLSGHVLFAGYDTGGNVGLWTTDGTAKGTSELTVAGAEANGGLTPTDLTQLGTLVVFNGIDANNTAGLWVTNGTGAGTSELTVAGAGRDFNPSGLTAVGSLVYFNAIDAAGNDGLWVTDGTGAGTSEITPISGANSGFYPTGFAQDLACFATGTRVRTLRGDIAVEDLRVGDSAVTQDGAVEPIVWIGHRALVCDRQPNPRAVAPVRIAAGAFGAGLPVRDLVLSPDHAVFADGVLIPVRHLLNGATVAQEHWPHVTYWHVELPRHAVLLAEGLPVESYLETGQRDAFANGGLPVRLHPDFVAYLREAASCVPVVVTGPVVEAVRARLAQPLPARAA